MQKQTTTLGLFLGGGQLAFAVVQCQDRVPYTAMQGSAPFALAPGQDEPEVLAAKLREILTQHRIKVRHCVLALPLSWIVSSRFSVAGVAAASIPEVAALELERLAGAPVTADQLVCLRADSSDQALALTVEPGVATHLTEACRLAGLKLACFVPAGTGTHSDDTTGTVVDVLPVPREVDALVWRDGKPAALRQLALRLDGSTQRLDECVQTAMRNLQVTLVSLPNAGTGPVSVRVLGGGHCAEAIANRVRERDDWRSLDDGKRIVAPPAVTAAILAGGIAGRDGSALCLPPPARERRQYWWSGRVARPVAAAALAVVLAVLAFTVAFVSRRLEVGRLEAKLAALEPQKLAGERLRDQLRLTAPWYRQTPERLAVLRAVAEAFPERGTVWATDLTIESDGKTALTGCALDHDSWTRALDALRARTRELGVVRIRQGAKASDPMTFSIVFSLPRPGTGGGA